MAPARFGWASYRAIQDVLQSRQHGFPRRKVVEEECLGHESAYRLGFGGGSFLRLPPDGSFNGRALGNKDIVVQQRNCAPCAARVWTEQA